MRNRLTNRGIKTWGLLVAAVVVLLVADLQLAEAANGENVVGTPSWIHSLELGFQWLTSVIIAFGTISVEFDLLHWAWTKLCGRAHPGARLAHSATTRGNLLPTSTVQRFNPHVRIQHIVLVISFIVLALTGLSEKFYRSPPFDDVVSFVGGLQTLRFVHRLAAVVMIVDGLYHILYVVTSAVVVTGETATVKISQWLEMIPNLNDVLDFQAMMGYYLGLRAQPPKFGHFSYMEKFDYWAVYWGMAMMAGTGLIMLVEALGIDIVTTPVLAGALAAHSDEAVLAVGWILIVHMYHAHLAPRVFPYNSTVFSGEISLSRLQEEHTLEYEELVKAMEEEREDTVQAVTRKRLRVPSD